jgi:hypothetical protein
LAVTVTPETFTLVKFEAPAIQAVVEQLLERLSLPDIDVVVEVNEESPLGATAVAALDPITIQADSGALEDPKKPRELSEGGTADALGRLLIEAGDRLDPGFGAPALDEDLALPVLVAWQVHCVGRLCALGYRDQRPRRLYHFRNRHGFTDVADRAFERLWSPEPLTFAQIQQLSDDALAGTQPEVSSAS